MITRYVARSSRDASASAACRARRGLKSFRGHEGPVVRVRPQEHEDKEDDVRLLGKWLLAMAAVALLSTASIALADHGGHRRGASAAATVFTLTPSTHGNPEGVAADGGTFYVGS